MPDSLLTQLRDIHYPPPISIWPLAIGWYIVLTLVLGIVCLASYTGYRYYQKHRLRKIVLMRLESLRQQSNTQTIAAELSMLLKRAALAVYSRQEVAGLHGEQWLDFLDKTGMTTEFSQGEGRLLIVSPYQKHSQPLPDQLFHLIRDWVKKNV